ncbi:MAG: urease accessory protein UreD, partial [Proteobacteria bacterium]|nr:urease accessory protein UreD [Pseudomonadota bacterium]
PFHVCRVQYLDPDLPDMASLYLQSSAGGLFAGDALGVSITCKPGAMAHVTTQASTIAYRMPNGEARQRTDLEVGENGFLEYLPDPVILFPQARLKNRLNLKLASNATAIVADAFLSHDPGGADRPFGFYRSETEITDAAGRRLVLDRFHTSGAACRAGKVGIMGAYGMQATIFAASTAVTSQSLLGAIREGLGDAPSVYAAASTLPNDCGAWVRLLADDGAVLRHAVAKLWMALRRGITGQAPAPRRK